MENLRRKEQNSSAPIAESDGLAVRTIVSAPSDRVG